MNEPLELSVLDMNAEINRINHEHAKMFSDIFGQIVPIDIDMRRGEQAVIGYSNGFQSEEAQKFYSGMNESYGVDPVQAKVDQARRNAEFGRTRDVLCKNYEIDRKRHQNIKQRIELRDWVNQNDSFDRFIRSIYDGITTDLLGEAKVRESEHQRRITDLQSYTSAN